MPEADMIAATQPVRQRAGSGGDPEPGQPPPQAQGPHDAVGKAHGPAAEGTLPGSKDCPPGTCPSCDEDRLKDSGPPRCLP